MSGFITLPRMGETMETGRVSAWLKKPGETFERGETIAEIETDKVTVEMPALDAGRLVEILVPQGGEVAVGERLGRYESPTGAAAPTDAAASPPAPASDPAARPAGEADAGGPAASSPVPGSGEPAGTDAPRRATPLARRLAQRAGLDLAALDGSGRRGRIERADVEAALLAREPDAPTLATSLPALRFVDLGGGRIAYREWGPAAAAGRTVLLLHGFSAEGATWAAVAAGLARGGTRVVAADLPGHGSTTLGAPSFDAVCDGIAELARALRLTEAEVLGHSMGGAVAARLAAMGRLSPRTLTLVAPAGLGGEIDADFVHAMATVASAGALSHLLRRLARRPPALSRPQLETMARDFAHGRLGALAADLAPAGRQGIDIVPDLGAVAAPVRLIWGLDDRILPWTQVAAAPSRAAVHLIAYAGHMPQWDKPQEFAALLA